MDDTKEDYSHLPPTQQKKKLTQKIDSLKQSIAKDTAERYCNREEKVLIERYCRIVLYKRREGTERKKK